MVTQNISNAELRSIKDVVVKGFARVEGRIDGLEHKFDARLDAVDARLDGVDTRLDSMDTRLGTVEGKIDSLEIKMDQGFKMLSTDIEDLAGMTAREFKAVRSKIAQRNLLQDA